MGAVHLLFWFLSLLIICFYRCQEVLKKAKLDLHARRCNFFCGYSCVDCCAQFGHQQEWKQHTSCITEQEKYYGAFYTPKKNKNSNEQAGNKRSANDHAKGNPPKKQKTDSNTEKVVEKSETKEADKGSKVNQIFTHSQWENALKEQIQKVFKFP